MDDTHGGRFLYTIALFSCSSSSFLWCQLDSYSLQITEPPSFVYRSLVMATITINKVLSAKKKAIISLISSVSMHELVCFWMKCFLLFGKRQFLWCSWWPKTDLMWNNEIASSSARWSRDFIRFNNWWKACQKFGRLVRISIWSNNAHKLSADAVAPDSIDVMAWKTSEDRSFKARKPRVHCNLCTLWAEGIFGVLKLSFFFY